jgi:hypothetical protein
MHKTNYVIVTGPDGTDDESDLYCCNHCQTNMRIPPPKDGHVISRVLPPCHGCGKFICHVCKAKGGCDTWERKMERAEKRYELRKSLGVEG